MPVTIEGKLAEVRLVERPNRFVLWGERPDGTRVKAHMPNPGRLTEFLVPGTRFLLRRRPDATREQATQWSVVAGWHNETWAMLDTQLANRLVADALEHGAPLADLFGDVDAYRAEPAHRAGRFDFQVRTREHATPFMVEVKSVTLLDEGDGRTGRFPDAPTERGRRHVEHLTAIARAGGKAMLLFIALRPDIRTVRPNAVTDPAFADALATAHGAGVQLAAYGAKLDVSLGSAELTGPLPVVPSP